MRKHYTLFLASVLGLGTTASSQQAITLAAAGYTAITGSDSLRMAGTPNNFSSAATAATNASWNYSSAAYSSAGIVDTRTAPASPNPFAGSSYYMRRGYAFGPSMSYITNGYATLSSGSLVRPGETISQRQAISLAAASMNPLDSAIFPVQTIQYSQPELMMQFPATMGSAWSSTSAFSTNFTVSIASQSLVNAPAVRKSIRQRVDSVVGWGKMQVRNAAGTASGAMPVLQVRSRVVVRDSFFLNGAPAPGMLLGAFNLAQGQMDTVWSVYFYRVGELSPLVEADWDINAYTGAPDEVYVHTQRLAPSTSGVGSVGPVPVVILIPNPVQRGQVLSLQTVEAGAWSATVMNLLGQPVLTDSWNSVVNSAHQVILPASLAAGTYSISVTHNGTPVHTGRVVLVD